MQRLAALCLALLAALSARASWADDAPERPNVLFLFTDDQRPDTIAALGNPHVITPNLDEIARSGFVFKNAYCLGSNVPAVCRPSRNMLLSGRAYFRFKGPMASADAPNFPGSMNDAGYVSYHYGKISNTAREIHKNFHHSRTTQDFEERTSGEPGKEIVDAAIEFLGAKDDRPFFMYLAFGNPHDPRVAAPKYMRMYDREKIPLPANYLPVHPFDNGEMTIRDEQLAPWPRTKDEVRKHLHEYYATITALDHHIGRLLAELKRRKEFDNTIIIFSSDHGLAVGSHGLMGKQNLYDHSMKAPLIFAGPGVPRGGSDALVYLHDIFPTTCDLVGAPIPPGLDGKTLKPILGDGKASVRDSLFTSYREVQRAVRDDRWKLIVYPRINRRQLFDLASDPHELRDLSASAEHQDQVARLTTLMESWQKDLNDATPLKSDAPQDSTFTPPAK